MSAAHISRLVARANRLDRNDSVLRAERNSIDLLIARNGKERDAALESIAIGMAAPSEAPARRRGARGQS